MSETSIYQADHQAELPPGATQEDLATCKEIICKLTDIPDQTELARKLLHMIYAKGGDYSEDSLRIFAEGYLR